MYREKEKDGVSYIYTEDRKEFFSFYPNSFGVMEQAKIDGNIRREKEGASGHK